MRWMLASISGRQLVVSGVLTREPDREFFHHAADVRKRLLGSGAQCFEPVGVDSGGRRSPRLGWRHAAAMTPIIHTAALSEKTHLRGLFHLARSDGRRNRSWHFWVGPAGLHVFWPDLYTSRPGWCRRWREPLV
jgi:hypothetical protein